MTNLGTVKPNQHYSQSGNNADTGDMDPDVWPYREAFRKVVADYQRRTGKKQLEVAAELGTTLGTLRGWLYSRVKKPSLDVLQRASALFGVSVTEFLDDPTPGDMVSAPPLGERARFMRRVMGSDLGAMSETEREAAFQAWKAIVEAFRAR